MKDSFHEYLVQGVHDAVNPAQEGTKCAAHYRIPDRAGRFRDSPAALDQCRTERGNVQIPSALILKRCLTSGSARRINFTRAVFRRSVPTTRTWSCARRLAGMMWTKQCYHYDVNTWLNGDPGQPPPPPERKNGRNCDWTHLYNADVLSMPDKWEYPWFAAWDLAFHTIAIALVDPDFAKEQLILLLREWYMHPERAASSL